MQLSVHSANTGRTPYSGQVMILADGLAMHDAGAESVGQPCAYAVALWSRAFDRVGDGQDCELEEARDMEFEYCACS